MIATKEGRGPFADAVIAALVPEGLCLLSLTCDRSSPSGTQGPR